MPAGATYEPIATNTLESNASSITFSSIPQTYTDLIVVANLGGYYTGTTWIDCGIQVGNGSIDTGANYSSIQILADGTGTLARSNATYVLYWVAAAASDDGYYPPMIAHINNYSNTTTWKPILNRFTALNPAGSVNTSGATVGAWRSTSAINTVRISNQNGTNFYAGSSVTLYGIKAA